MKRKVLSIFIVFAIFILMIPNVVFGVVSNVYLMENFANMNENELPNGFICGENGGSIRVETVKNNKVVHLKNGIDGLYTSLKYTFAKISDLIVTSGLDYMQDEVKVNGNVILQLEGSSGIAVSIETANGNIIYKTGKKTFQVLVSNYLPNYWYNIIVKTDLSTKTSSVFVNGVAVAKNLPLYQETSSIESLSSFTCYSPGYYLDNVGINTSQTVKEIIIDGNDKVSIAKSSETQYTYKAKVLDTLLLPVSTSQLSFKLYPENPVGVCLVKGDNVSEVKLVVSDKALEGEITLYAVLDGEQQITGNKKIYLQKAELSSMKVAGPVRIASYRKELYEYQYSAQFLDELGNKISDHSCIWSLTGEVPGCVKIDTQTGLLTVSAELPKDKKITVNATSVLNSQIVGQKSIVMLDWKTYQRDQARYNVMIRFADSVLEKGKDIYGGTPLLADGIDIGTGLPFEWQFPVDDLHPESAALSNLADQSGLMRFFKGFSAITGDSKYYDRVLDIYRYFIDNFIAPNGLCYWGGHTTVDLKTGKVCYTPNDMYTHELKNHFPFLEPMFELNSEQASKSVKAIWAGHISDFSTLLFNRHALYTKELDFLSTWDNVNIYDESQTGLLKSTSLAFRISANDFIYAAVELYNHTKDEKALTWAYRLWRRYKDVCNTNTGLGGEVFTTAYGASGTQDPLKVLEPVGSWWLADPMPDNYTYTSFGDRAYNQFAIPLLNAGIIKESQLDMIREANFIFNFSTTSYCPPVELELAKIFGKDSEKGREIIGQVVKQLGSYANYAYIPETNQLKVIWADGTDMSGYVVERSGYFYKAGTVLTPTPATHTLMFPYAKTYFESMGRDDLKKSRSEVWQMLRGLCKGFGIGEIGVNYPGDNMKLNMNTSYASHKAAYTMAYLFNQTGIVEYLDMARHLADNSIKTVFRNDVFMVSPYYKNIQFSGEYESYPIMLLTLEAIIRGEYDSLPIYYPYDGFFNADLVKPNGRIIHKAQAPGTVWKYMNSTVLVTDIIPEKNEYVLKVGEEIPINLTIEPDDAFNLGISWSNSDPTVARYDNLNNTLYAIKSGETTLYATSNDLNAKQSIKITVSQ